MRKRTKLFAATDLSIFVHLLTVDGDYLSAVGLTPISNLVFSVFPCSMLTPVGFSLLVSFSKLCNKIILRFVQDIASICFD